MLRTTRKYPRVLDIDGVAKKKSVIKYLQENRQELKGQLNGKNIISFQHICLPVS